MSCFRLVRIALAAALLSSLPFAIAQQSAPAAPDAIGLDSRLDPAIAQKIMGHRTAFVGNVSISPDGTTVMMTSRGKGGSRIELVSLDASGTRRTLSAGPAGKDCSTSNGIWSPDGKTIAASSDCFDSADSKADQEHLALINVADGKSRLLATLQGNVEDVAWSPDGRQISLLYVPNSTRPSGAVAAQRVPEGVIDMQQVSEVQRLATVDSATGALTLISPPQLHIYEYDWSADSHTVVYTAAPAPGENNWWVAKLYSQPATAGAQPTVILDPTTVAGGMHGLQIAVPKISPDGSQVAFIGGLMSDFGSTGGDIWSVPTAGGSPANLTEGRKSTPVWITWTSPKTILFTELEQGEEAIRKLDVATSTVEKKTYFKEPESIGGGRGASMQISVANDGKVAFSRSGFDRAPEAWAGPLDHLQQITHLNANEKPSTRTISLTWQNEGYSVQGWLTFPADYDKNKRYPMIVSVHGGPAASVTARWSSGGYSAAFTSAGYFFFQPNPRGSFGQGEAFVQANRKDFGYGDLRDVLAGMDKIVKDYPVDPNRIGLTGGSYGGFMSMFAPTQTQRFKAAVAVAGISDWLSYYGENSIDQWMIPYFGASVYDAPDVYAKMSAINFVHNIKTPMLIIVGDRDGECPAPQSFEIWHALRDLNVPTELVVYPDEGHGLSKPQHAMDALAKTLAWFAKYMPAQ